MKNLSNLILAKELEYIEKLGKSEKPIF